MNKYRTEEEQLAAVKHDGYLIRHIKNPSEIVQIAAVKQNGYAIQYFKYPSEKIQLTAVKQNGNAIQYINNPSEATLEICLLSNDCDISLLKDEWFNGKSAALRLAYEIMKGI